MRINPVILFNSNKKSKVMRELDDEMCERVIINCMDRSIIDQAIIAYRASKEGHMPDIVFYT